MTISLSDLSYIVRSDQDPATPEDSFQQLNRSTSGGLAIGSRASIAATFRLGLSGIRLK